MIQGYFGSQGEMFFEIDLIPSDGSIITVNALLDTGFTGWLAMDNQDVESLGWIYLDKLEMRTARGDARFNLYEGTVIFDRQQLTVPVLCGKAVPEILIGLPRSENRRLVADRKANLLTLE